MVSPCLIQLFVKETVPLQQTNVQDALLPQFVLPVQSDFNFQPARPLVNHFAASINVPSVIMLSFANFVKLVMS